MSSTSQAVAEHYNAIPQTSHQQRAQSDIFHLRKFNNWVKSVLIDVAVEELLQNGATRDSIETVDVACGKGGDLQKWQAAGVKSVTFVDVAGVSIEQARERYYDMRDREQNNRWRNENSKPLYDASFHVCSMYSRKFVEECKLQNDSKDILSIQFAFHYAFDTEQHAHNTFRSIARVLKKGGVFIGTTPNADRIMALLRANNGHWENEACKIITDDSRLIDADKKPPLFGGTYKFTLGEQVVDCPEFLVNRSLLPTLGKIYGLELVSCDSFADFFKRNVADPKYRGLTDKMKALEKYPNADVGAEEVKSGGNRDDYADAARKYAELQVPLGVLRKTEAQVADLYVAFMFVKQ